MPLFPDNNPIFLIGSPISPNDPTSQGSHISHMGTGGFVEFKTLQDVYDIPTQEQMNLDTFSSGRRKVGMIVYVFETNKFYQLRPRKNDLSYVTVTEWNNADPGRQLVWLQPDKTGVWDLDGINPITGTGNPADCWTEVCLDCGGGGLEFLDVYTDATLTSLSANKIIHFHTNSTTNLTVSLDFTNSDSSLQCSPGFNTAVMNAGAGMLTLSGVKGVSTVLDAQNSGAFIYVKSPGDAYAVGRL